MSNIALMPSYVWKGFYFEKLILSMDVEYNSTSIWDQQNLILKERQLYEFQEAHNSAEKKIT